MKQKIINYFFDEDEMDLVPKYERLVKIAVVSLIVTMFLRMI